MRYSGRDFNDDEIQWLNAQIAQDPDLTRTILSRRFCEQFGWKKSNGTLKDVSCRVALLRMEEDHLLTLPARRMHPRPARFLIKRTLFGEPRAAITKPAGSFQLSLDVVTQHSSGLWNELIDRYHYLGYQTLPGAQLRYLVRDEEDIIACLGFGAPAWKVASRDRFIGWTTAQREGHLHLVVNNARFLIMPWVRSHNLGSRILSLVQHSLGDDWEQVYHVRPVLLETFVEQRRFTGAVYKASNWLCVGETTGRGKKSRSTRPLIPIKTVWLFPLHRHFRSILCGRAGRS